MSSNSILDQERFWTVIEYLTTLDQKKDFDNICGDLSITKPQLNSFINFLKEVDYQLEVVSTKSGKEVVPPVTDSTIKIEFTLLEWLEFQAHFPAMGELEGKPFHNSFKSKLELLEKENSNHDLFAPLPTLENILDNGKIELVSTNSKNGIVAFIEESIIDKKTIQLELKDKNYKILPHKIVFIEGELNLIGESLFDGCLLSIGVSNIVKTFEDNSEWKMNYSKLEVDEFIKSFRCLGDNTVRIVLKIFSQERFNLNLNHQFFEKPCMFSNTSGEYIWAATIEPNVELYEWLCELGSDIEILDPTSFKLDFLKYCENKLKKLA
jgi:hypothetical protein